MLQLSADYPTLHGEFGVVRMVTLHLQNPSATPQTVNLYAAPVNGPDTITMWFNGDAAPTEIGRIADPPMHARSSARSSYRQRARKISAHFSWPTASSWFPLELGLTATPVNPPPQNAFDVCTRALLDQVSALSP